MSTHTNLPPYPRLGELYRTLAVALETKDRHPNVDELARKGEFDWTLLPTLADTLIVDPLAKYVDPGFANMVGQFLAHVHENYLGLVLTVSLDSLSREESLPLIVEHYFAVYGLELLYRIKEAFSGPDLVKFLDPDIPPVATVLAWLDEDEALSLVKLAYPETTGVDRNATEKYRKWSNGTDIPDRQSIIGFANAVKAKGSVRDEKVQNLRRWLMVARTLAQLERKSPVPFRAVMGRHLLLGMPKVDIGSVLSKAVLQAGEHLSALHMPALTLYERLKRATLKECGEQSSIKMDLDEFERMTSKVDPEGRTRFHIEWMRGRWQMLSGNFELALPHYEAAAELANYRAGEQQKRILEETLVLSGHLGKVALLKRLKHRAVAFGLFVEPRGKVIEEWEIDLLRQQFPRVFPAHGRFPEASSAAADREPLPFLMIARDDIQRIRPDRRTPNRVVSIRLADGQVRRWPQLRLFASFGKYDEVKTLLEAGAPVDDLDESGASALLCAIQYATQTGDRRTLDLLLKYSHSPAVLNSVTTMKQLTPLLCAVDLGEPDIVETLLRMKASADLRGNIVDQTPLHYAAERFGVVRDPGTLYRHLYRSLTADPDSVVKEIHRRYRVSLTGTFGDGAALRTLRETPRYRELFEQLVSAMVKEQIDRHSIPKLTRIIGSLLERKACPNAAHHYPVSGRTPLMLAAESNSEQVFDLMFRHGGNPHQADAGGMTCLSIAMAFGSADVIGYMRRKGIM